MNFIYKCYLQKFFSLAPRGERLNYLLQRYITRSLPGDDKRFIHRLNIAKEQFDIFNKYSSLAKTHDITYYEFGAGCDLINPIGLSLLGIQTLYCIDIRELVFPELINDTISKLHRLKEQIPFDYSLPERIPQVTVSNVKDILSRYFRIYYRAPVDAKCTNLPESTIDLIVSNFTLEHIPAGDIPGILKECHRILKKGGIVTLLIDYTDHWSYFDRSISRYNFLKYSPTKWKRYNPALHYQNRLRHRDYLDIIKHLDFSVLEDKPHIPSKEDLDFLSDFPIDSYFTERYTLDELAIKCSRIILTK